MKKASKLHAKTIRINKTSLRALKQSQRDFIKRDLVPYTLNEVIRYVINVGLYSQGKLTTVPQLDGDGSTQLAKQAHFKKRMQKQLRLATAQK